MEAKFLVVSLDDNTKKIPIEKETSFVQVGDILKEKFGSGIGWKYLDNDVSDWIDLDEDSWRYTSVDRIVRLRGCRLQIKLVELDVAANSLSTVPDEVGIIDIEEEVPVTVERRPNTPTPKRLQSAEQKPNSSTPKILQSAEQKPNSSTPKILQSPDALTKRKEWPRKYVFPDDIMPRSIQMKPSANENLEKRESRLLMDALYNDITRYEGGMYPSSKMYEEVVDSLLAAHPYLLKVGDLPAQSVRDYWKGKLIFKFGDARNRESTVVPEIKERKRKKAEETEISVNVGSLTWGMANCRPGQISSEDEDSVQKHKDWLNNEWKKSEPNIALVDMKMDLTFGNRREFILGDGSQTIANILQEYPWFQSRNQLLREFMCLGPNTKQSSLEDLFYDGFNRYHQAINKLTQTRKLKERHRELLDIMSAQKIDSQRKYTSQCSAILGLAVLFKEKPERLLQFGGQGKKSQGTIFNVVKQDILTTEEDAFSLKVEGMTIFKCETFLELIVGFIGAIYSFNLVYPKAWEKTMLFIQNVVIGLQDGQLDKKNHFSYK